MSKEKIEKINPYRFSVETKEQIKREQSYRCADCNAHESEKKLTAHHNVPIHYAKNYLQKSEEVLDYISGKENCIMLCQECHAKQHKFEDLQFYELIITQALGICALIEKQEEEEEEKDGEKKEELIKYEKVEKDNLETNDTNENFNDFDDKEASFLEFVSKILVKFNRKKSFYQILLNKKNKNNFKN